MLSPALSCPLLIRQSHRTADCDRKWQVLCPQQSTSEPMWDPSTFHPHQRKRFQTEKLQRGDVGNPGKSKPWPTPHITRGASARNQPGRGGETQLSFPATSDAPPLWPSAQSIDIQSGKIRPDHSLISCPYLPKGEYFQNNFEKEIGFQRRSGHKKIAGTKQLKHWI